MTGKKMMQILLWIAEQGINPIGIDIHTSTGGEIALDFRSQPDQHVHKYMLSRGFVYVNTQYIYRP